MKFNCSIILSALAYTASASPIISLRQAETAQDSINKWNGDITIVNEFLNSVGSSSTPSADAMPVLATALDEPVQLMFLTSMIASDATAAMYASNTLIQMFGQVPEALMNIVAANNDPTIVAANVATINNVRCNVVLPNIGVLWAQGGFPNAGSITVPLGPAVCPNPGPNGGPYPMVAA
ncbi:uncharacterized protein LY89DRAFT_787774 [Mollisia scopiformis]|uniref:Uncharacterized protein n=1 Tax=Mollisia scopiformis TaxID=149040 RepID=A0A132BD14_MOLSC|nr:uncharacterized protein LY89DRAFT_787774 [Mollisia scopiformis]KUJ10143.1 hypothetical protein LY89DRAFT_787774 [Mollisia scopiformis]